MEHFDPSYLHGQYSCKLDGIPILFSISEGETIYPSYNGYFYISYCGAYTTSFFVSFPVEKMVLVGGVVDVHVLGGVVVFL